MRIYERRLIQGFSASCSVGSALTDTLDDLITENRIDPQLAMKILANFDRAITEVLQDKVRSRLTFKVNTTCYVRGSKTLLRRLASELHLVIFCRRLANHGTLRLLREVWIPTASATKSGPSS
jgi:hypothetical protein